jgi:hypothetical protein
MEVTPTTIILVGVISAVLGFLASSLLHTLRDEGAEPVAEDEPVPPGGRKGRYTPIARLWRERSKGTLVVEIDGRSLVDATPLDADQRERLETAGRDFRAFLGMGLPAGAPPAVPSPAAGQPPGAAAAPGRVDEGAATAGATASTWAVSGEELEGSLRRALNQDAPGQPARAGTPPLKPAAPARPASDRVVEEPKAAPAGPKSIVMQIEDVLQDMLAGTTLEQRGIHLSEDPVRGVIVTVGVNQYEGIEAVPDLEVKSAIRAAVAAWEQAQ